MVNEEDEAEENVGDVTQAARFEGDVKMVEGVGRGRDLPNSRR